MSEPRSGKVASSAGSGNGPLRGHGLLAKLGWALRSDAGHGRPRNEDFAGVFAPTTPDDAWDRGPLFVVCDGRGGNGAGALASRTAVEAALAEWTGPDPGGPAVAIRAAASAANDAVCAAARTRGQPGMATTFTALTLAGREAVIVHLGYSRCYLVRSGMCTQLTADHAVVEETWPEVPPGLEAPGSEPPHLESPGRRPQLLGAPGSEGAVQVDLFMADTEAGDVFVLCSDGLSLAVTPGEIAEWAGAVGTACGADGRGRGGGARRHGARGGRERQRHGPCREGDDEPSSACDGVASPVLPARPAVARLHPAEVAVRSRC